jgi:hypothetical protein
VYYRPKPRQDKLCKFIQNAKPLLVLTSAYYLLDLTRHIPRVAGMEETRIFVVALHILSKVSVIEKKPT